MENNDDLNLEPGDSDSESESDAKAVVDDDRQLLAFLGAAEEKEAEHFTEVIEGGLAIDTAPEEVATQEVIDVEDFIEEEPIAPRPKASSPYDRPGDWFVLHTQSGYEKKVKSNLESRISSMTMEDSIFEVVIPMEEVIEFKAGKKVVAQKKVFPGYLYVRCFLDERSWDVIRNTPGVTGFVGSAGKPIPLSRHDVELALAEPEEVEYEPGTTPKRQRPKLEYEIGDTVRVKEGPFADFSGQIAEINEDQLKVKVLVNIFGRETPVELEFTQVAKL
ncbi:MAG: transcription termination/antitermination protein NusG [Acidimicrobiales bacterium]